METDASGNVIARMGRFDVNPADPHVVQDGPHLNLETHVNGRPVSNTHDTIDVQTIMPGDYP